ncbi:hypothetical protein PInf_022796 [Phytophthora infestans]|nr:hypothetical protein PInf_022796 [Phytophthora infestans]
MARGRRTGYSNYSLREQLLLCAIVEKTLPIGRNEWERITIHYNSRRGRISLERDLESLRRKFETLYKKPKPSGNGEVKPAHKAILWAKRIQMEIEEKVGSQATFDGAVEGEGSGNGGNSGSNSGLGLAVVPQAVSLARPSTLRLPRTLVQCLTHMAPVFVVIRTIAVVLDRAALVAQGQVSFLPLRNFTKAPPS